jgi:hypothetical protein
MSKNFKNIKLFDGEQNLQKKLELTEQILPLISGYSFKQIEESFQSVLIEIKNGLVINLED